MPNIRRPVEGTMTSVFRAVSSSSTTATSSAPPISGLSSSVLSTKSSSTGSLVSGKKFQQGRSIMSLSCSRFGVEEFWRGSMTDPALNGSEKTKAAWSGQAWPACLLRLKSFDDLHKLWYVCLKEKNYLMSERHAANQLPDVQWRNHGRLKKVKLTMKRILGVLSRREIHQQAIRAKEILKFQQKREELETKRFHLDEQLLQLKAKIKRMGNDESVQKASWRVSQEKVEHQLEVLKHELIPLRKMTMQLLIPDWRYCRKYSDLPGTIRWKKQWVRALDETKQRPFRFY